MSLKFITLCSINQAYMTTEETLAQTVKSLTEVNDRQARQIEEMTAEIRKLSAQIAWFQKQMFS